MTRTTTDLVAVRILVYILLILAVSPSPMCTCVWHMIVACGNWVCWPHGPQPPTLEMETPAFLATVARAGGRQVDPS